MSNSEGNVLFENGDPPINAVDSDNFVTIVDNNYTFEYKGWDAIEHFRQLRIDKKNMNIPNPETVKSALHELTHQRQRKKTSNSLRLYELLESAGKLFGNGPKWSNPDHSQFNRMNESRLENGELPLIYIKKPKFANQKNEMYYYKLQFPSDQQKLQAKTRYSEAVKYGLILPQDSDSFNYTLNKSPWDLPKYKNLWDDLSKELKSEPWKSQTCILQSYIKPKPKESNIIPNNPITINMNLNEPSQPTIPRSTNTTSANNNQFTFNPKKTIPNFPGGNTKLTDLFNDSVNRNTANNEMSPKNTTFSSKSQKKIIEDDILAETNSSGNNPLPISNADSTREASSSLEASLNATSSTLNASSTLKANKDSTSHDKSPNDKDLTVDSITAESDQDDSDYTAEDYGHDSASELDFYQPINSTSSKPRRRILDDEVLSSTTLAEDTSLQLNSSSINSKGKNQQNVLTKSEKRRRLDFLNKMFEYEAEESEDENISDPEYRKKIKLLRKKRLEEPSDSEEFTSDDNLEELGDFLTTANNLNPEDEELARQRFLADMYDQDEERLKRLMAIKEKISKSLAKHKATTKKLRNRLGNDYHLSDFESSDEDSILEFEGDELTEDDDSQISGDNTKIIKKPKERTINRDKMLLFAKNLSEEQLELLEFLDFKLNTRLESIDSNNNKDIDEITDYITPKESGDNNKLIRKFKLDSIELKTINLLRETDKGNLREILREKSTGHFQSLIRRNNNNNNNLNKIKYKTKTTL